MKQQDFAVEEVGLGMRPRALAGSVPTDDMHTLHRARERLRVQEDVDAPLRLLRDGDARPSWRWAEVLLKPGFLQQLHREKRRADRSQASLSIVVCDGSTCYSEPFRNEGLARLLTTRKRLTDVVGQLDDGVFAVLLPDTGKAGADRFAENVKQELPCNAGVLVLARTYPDQLFDSLLAGNYGPLDLFPFLTSTTGVAERQGYSMKRMIDIIGAVVLLILFAPIIAATALCIAATSRGPVIFRQVRLRKGAVPFVFYKFRSMRVDAKEEFHRNYVESLIDGKLEAVNEGGPERPLYKRKVDPRVTPIGRIIRKTSIDELPQLWNVLRGEMSLVGPRPPIPYEVERYQPWHLRRILEVKPGITGLWQVEGRSRTTFDEMVRLDLRYTRRCSLAVDLKILLKTIYVVLKCDGAN
jgi:lipopolysaccharide/colanic/teichoic acid biosynthesis glycosyltransferase